MYRKILLRRRLLQGFSDDCVIYVPFIGDGDIAVSLYSGMKIYGADIIGGRAETARDRLPSANIKRADCNFWPFPEVKEKFEIADFDAYSYPYASFVSFWMFAEKADEVALFFTDGTRQAIKRSGRWHKPNGKKEVVEDLAERRKLFNFYLPRFILPWFREFIEPYELVRISKYVRESMIYWGAVVKK